MFVFHAISIIEADDLIQFPSSFNRSMTAMTRATTRRKGATKNRTGTNLAAKPTGQETNAIAMHTAHCFPSSFSRSTILARISTNTKGATMSAAMSQMNRGYMPEKMFFSSIFLALIMLRPWRNIGTTKVVVSTALSVKPNPLNCSKLKTVI